MLLSFRFVAQEVGFEPTHGISRLTVFKTVPFDHLGTPAYLAWAQGLEPRLTVLETAVLPIERHPYMAGEAGLEPATTRLTAGGSTIELPANIQNGQKDGARTRNLWSHNPALCQKLSYFLRVVPPGRFELPTCRLRGGYSTG